MAAMFRQVRNISRYLRLRGCCQRAIVRRLVVGTMAVSAAGLSVDDKEKDVSLEVDTDQLSATYLTKMASIQAVNAATTLLTQSLSVLLDLMDKYVELLGTLIQLMELQLEVIGNQFREDKVWDAMMEIRRQVNDCKAKKLEVEAIFHSAEKALQAAGEAAHMTGAVYAGIAANERVFSATSQLQHRQHIVEKAETELYLMEAKCIEKIGEKNRHRKTDATKTGSSHLLAGEQENADLPEETATHAENKGKSSDDDDDIIVLGDIFEQETYSENSEEDFSHK